VLSREMQRRLKELAAALKAEPGSIPRRLELAAALREASRPNDAIELYRGVAAAYAEEGRLVQAMAVCKGILEIDAGHRETLEMLATLAQHRQQRRAPGPAEVKQVAGRWVAEPTGTGDAPASDSDVDRSAEDMTPPSMAGFSPARREAPPTDLPRLEREPATRIGADPDSTRAGGGDPHDVREALLAQTPADGIPLYPEGHGRDTDPSMPAVTAPTMDLPPLDFPPETKRLARGGERLLDLKFADSRRPSEAIDTLRTTTVTDEELARHDTPSDAPDESALPPVPGDKFPSLGRTYSDDETRAATRKSLETGRPPSERPSDEVWNSEESGATFIESVITGPFPRQELLVEPPPFPLLSDLPREAFMELLARMSVVRLPAGEVVLREGDAGDACYLVASGSVRVSKKDVEVALLGPGSFFGEFAVLADQRRHASVTTLEAVELLEIRRGLLDELVAQHPGVARTLRRFYRERLLSTLIATAPFFQRLRPEERASVAERFRPRRFGRGARIIEEGSPGGGLFLILVGEVQVVRAQEGGSELTLGTLGEGSYFGEMSLLRGGVASATVRATRTTEVVQLPPRDFYEVVSQHPVLWDHLRSEAERRDLANHAIVSGEARKSEDGSVYLV
jgi:CRP-like cAMP-binding protein